MANTGRPSKLTPEVKERFLKALKAGAHIDTAAAAAGVSYEAIREWIRRGEGRHATRASNADYVQFAHDVTRAIADAEMALVSQVNLASRMDWRAASWILERRHPDRWANSQRVKIEVAKELEATLDKLEKSLPSEVFNQVLDAIADDGDRSEAES